MSRIHQTAHDSFRCGLLRTVRGRCVLAILIGLGLVLALFVKGRLLYVYWFIPAVFLVAEWLVIRQLAAPDARKRSSGRWAAPMGLLFLFLVWALFSGWTQHKWFYFLDWPPRMAPMTIEAGATRFLLLSALILPLVLRGMRHSALCLALLCAWTAGQAGHRLLANTEGLGLYIQDHSSFMYRFFVAGQTLPRLINYTPYWNAGTLETTPALSGVPALAYLFLPWLGAVELPVLYPWILVCTFLGLVPLLAAIALRGMGSSWTAAGVAALLAMGVSRHFFLWLLNYGTSPACLVSALALPLAALGYRIVYRQRYGWKEGIALVILAGLAIQWAPGFFILGAIAFSLLVNARRVQWRRWPFFLPCGLCIGLIALQMLLFVLWRPQFSDHGETAAESVFSFLSGWKTLWWHLREVHPLLLFMGFGALMATGRTAMRRWFLPIVWGLILLVGWGNDVFGDFQLQRMSIPLGFVLIAPASVGIGRLLTDRTLKLAWVRAPLWALLVLTAVNTPRIYQGLGGHAYQRIPDQILDFSSAVRTNLPETGRLVLAGSTGLRYAGAYIPFLPILAGRETLAPYYRHSQEVNPLDGCAPLDPPETPEAFLTYVKRFGVHGVATVHDNWRKFLRAQPEEFRETGNFPGRVYNITLFEVQHPEPLFAKGTGEVDARMNRLVVYPSDPNEEQVIRYLWKDGLRTSPPSEIYPVTMPDGIVFIGIRPQGAREVVIRYRGRI